MGWVRLDGYGGEFGYFFEVRREVFGVCSSGKNYFRIFVKLKEIRFI